MLTVLTSTVQVVSTHKFNSARISITVRLGKLTRTEWQSCSYTYRNMWNNIWQSRILIRTQPYANIIYRRAQRKNLYNEEKRRITERNHMRIEKMSLQLPRPFRHQPLLSPEGCSVISPCNRRLRKRKFKLDNNEMDRTPDSHKSYISHQSLRDRSPRVPQPESCSKRRKIE